MNSDLEKLWGPLKGQIGYIFDKKYGQNIDAMDEKVQHFSYGLKKMAEGLREKDENSWGDYADSAAQSLESISHELKTSNKEELYAKLEKLNDDNPLGVFMVSMLAGAATARVGKTAYKKTSNTERFDSDIDSFHDDQLDHQFQDEKFLYEKESAAQNQTASQSTIRPSSQEELRVPPNLNSSDKSQLNQEGGLL